MTAFYVILLIVLGIKSIGGKSPLLIWQLFLMPIIGVVLSFAARRTIRNAEGTRTGENLANLAWWGAVVGGLGYGAYYLAIEFAIRRDAADEVNRWVKNIIQDDPANPAHPGLSLAFNETLEPDRRRAGSDASQLEAEFREQFIAFTQCNLVRLVQRNPGECRYEDGGVKEWVNRQYGIDCQYSGAVKCREGVFPLLIPVKGIESGIVSQTPGRKWLVSIPPNGLFVPEGSTRTPYGWLVELLEQSGTQFGKDFFAVIGTGGPSANSMIIHDAPARIRSPTRSPTISRAVRRTGRITGSRWCAARWAVSRRRAGRPASPRFTRKNRRPISATPSSNSRAASSRPRSRRTGSTRRGKPSVCSLRARA